MHKQMVILALMALSVASCREQAQPAGGDAALQVFAGIPPIGYLARRVGGDVAEVNVLVMAGQDAHTFEPAPSQAVALSRADLFLHVDLPFEQRMAGKLGAGRPTIVDLRDGVELLEMGDDEHAHEHDEHQHEHGELDPHIWMSPRIAATLAEKIAQAFIQADPRHAEQYQQNLDQLQDELRDLHQQLQQQLAPLAGQTLYVFHPAFGYFAHEYGLEQVAVETGGKSPGPKRLAELIAQAQADNVKVIFVQPQFSSRAADAIAEQIGGAVVPLDPLAADYIENLRRIATIIKSQLNQPSAPTRPAVEDAH